MTRIQDMTKSADERGRGQQVKGEDPVLEAHQSSVPDVTRIDNRMLWRCREGFLTRRVANVFDRMRRCAPPSSMLVL